MRTSQSDSNVLVRNVNTLDDTNIITQLTTTDDNNDSNDISTTVPFKSINV